MRKESLLWEDGSEWREWKRKKNSSVEMTVEIRRIQVGQVWRTEVPYGPRKPAPAWRPPGPHATSLSVLPSATTIYHLRGSVILSRLRLSITDTSSWGRTYRDWERDARECVHIIACRRICFDHIPSSRIIGSAMYKVFFCVSSSLCALYERVMIFRDTRKLESYIKSFI